VIKTSFNACMADKLELPFLKNMAYLERLAWVCGAGGRVSGAN